MKRVWIVGAGFSRSLGAPLLNDLLSPAARMRIQSQYSDVLPPPEADQVFWLYHYGTDFAEGTLEPIAITRGVRRWRDAEQFLEILDDACDNSRVAEELKTLWSKFRSKCGFPTEELPEPTAFRKNAKRVVAASCSGFLEGQTRDSVRTRERWLPYLNWLVRLRENDTIVSFNYDRVIELLQPRHLENYWDAHVAGIDGSIEDTELATEAQEAGLPTLLKLHGSVDWIVVDKKIERREWSRDLLAAPNDPGIATPGPQKMTMAERFFQRLWRAASQRLAEADELYVLGFRFPESDAHPRERLLSALDGNTREKLRVHVVLGPDVTGKDSRRVLDLLQWIVAPSRMIIEPKAQVDFRNEEQGGFVLNERVILAHALYVEDFLTVWTSRNEIPPPRPAGA